MADDDDDDDYGCDFNLVIDVVLLKNQKNVGKPDFEPETW